jgi:hypothetical protein
MESLTKKEKVIQSVKLTGNELFELQQAVSKTLMTSERIKGLHVRLLLDNLSILDPIIVPLVTEHSKVITKYVKTRENGTPMRDETGFHFAKDEDKVNYEKESDEIFNKEINIDLCKFSVSVFDEIEFNTKENNTVYLVLKHLTV